MLLKKCYSNEILMKGIITGDKRWIYAYDMAKKVTQLSEREQSFKDETKNLKNYVKPV